MEVVSRQLGSKKSTTNLYMKSQLQTVEEFAARYGIAERIIKECASLGLIKTRKCKGKIFVLDIPASRYQDSAEDSNEQLNYQVLHAQKIAELAEKIPAHLSQESKAPLPITAYKPTKATPSPTGNKPILAKAKQADSFTRTDTFLLGISAKQTSAKTKWKLAALSVLVLLCATVFMNIWLYTDRNIKTGTIEKYHLSYQKIYEEASKIHQNAEFAQDTLNAYKAELDSTKDSLKRTSQYLNIIEKQNTKNAENLNKQILKLADELSDPTLMP